MLAAECLKKAELFEGLDEAQLNALMAHSKVERFPVGKIIFRQEEEATHLYLLIEGAVDLSVEAEGGMGLLASHMQTEGAIFGTPSLLEPFRHRVTAKCILPAQVLSIESSFLREKMEEDPRMGMRIMKKLALVYYQRLNDLRKGVVNFFKVFQMRTP
jgi:CRP/FNR family cyclic AMP-dependent transcriptional regulator